MRTAWFRSILLLSFTAGFGCSACIGAQAAAAGAAKPGEPTDAKARKTFEAAVDWQKHREYGAALDSYRKANKQDGGHCTVCLERAYKLALEIGAYKDAEEVAREMVNSAPAPDQKAAAHFRLAIALQREGMTSRKAKCFAESCEEFHAALDSEPALTSAHFSLGVSLAHLHQDDDARREFSLFLEKDRQNPAFHDRAQIYRDKIELARANMAPPFSLVTLDGQQVSMDGLAGKVVLIDFWATWCGPCREALPHIKKIAEKFAGQPMVVLSISLDSDEAKWKDFVQKNEMTWLQYRDGGFNGHIARLFGVTAIPATFTIDADGVLEDQHVGDASIEGKLKKLVARAEEVAKHKPPAVSAQPATETN
jgi:thiol-disulfide isomerase/thioredoxin